MSYEQKDNQVVLFLQDKTSEKSPSYTGDGLVGGKKWQVCSVEKREQEWRCLSSVEF